MIGGLHKLECVAWRYMAWGQLIADLVEAGYSQLAIAHALNVPPTSLQNWKNGSEPRYSHGEALLLLHSRVFTPERTRNSINEFRRAALMRTEDPANPQGAEHACSATQSRSTR